MEKGGEERQAVMVKGRSKNRGRREREERKKKEVRQEERSVAGVVR